MLIVHILISNALSHVRHEHIKVLHDGVVQLGRVPIAGEEVILSKLVGEKREDVVVTVVKVCHIGNPLPQGPCAHVWIE
jgi:hypothetical protein